MKLKKKLKIIIFVLLIILSINLATKFISNALEASKPEEALTSGAITPTINTITAYSFKSSSLPTITVPSSKGGWKNLIRDGGGYAFCAQENADYSSHGPISTSNFKIDCEGKSEGITAGVGITNGGMAFLLATQPKETGHISDENHWGMQNAVWDWLGEGIHQYGPWCNYAYSSCTSASPDRGNYNTLKTISNNFKSYICTVLSGIITS